MIHIRTSWGAITWNLPYRYSSSTKNLSIFWTNKNNSRVLYRCVKNAASIKRIHFYYNSSYWMIIQVNIQFPLYSILTNNLEYFPLTRLRTFTNDKLCQVNIFCLLLQLIDNLFIFWQPKTVLITYGIHRNSRLWNNSWL